MANKDVTTRIQVIMNAKQAENVMKQLRNQTKAWENELKQLEQNGKGKGKRADFLRQMIPAARAAEKETVTATTRIQNAVNNLANTSTRDLRRAAREARRLRDSLAASDPKFKEASANLAKIETQIAKNTGAVVRHGSAWKTTIKNMMAYVGVFGALNMVKSKIEEIISMNNKLSDQMANIRKVSNLPMSDIKELTKNVYKTDTRTSPTEMLDIAYAGAKLGMANGGVEQLESFTKAANVVNVALKEDMGAESLTALSKMVENMGLLKQMNIEDAMNKVGSAMFRLASTSTATSTNIVEFSKRLTAMARVAGITTPQLLALGSASDSLYLAPEVAATAFTKLFSSLQTNHNLIEKTLSIPKGTINDLFSAGKAMDAVVLIFQKMHDMGNMNALKPIFKDLGSDGARLMNVMTAMAKNVDVLKEHLETSNEAYKDGTAVLDEYNIQQQTSAALMERANNLWAKAFVNEDAVDIVHELSQAWYDFSKSLTSSQTFVVAVRLALEGLINLMKGLLFLLPSIIMGLGAQGLVLTFQRLASIIGGAGFAIGRLVVAFKALSLAAKANWIVAIASGIAFLTSKILEMNSSVAKGTGFMEGFTTSLGGVSSTIAQSRAELESFSRAIWKTAQGTEQHKIAIENFNKKFGTYLSKLLTEKSTAKDLARAYEEVNSALEKKAYLELKQKDLKQFVVPRAGHERNAAMTYDNSIKGTSSAGYNSKMLRAFYDAHRGMSVDNMVRLLAIDLFNNPMTGSSVESVINASHKNGNSDDISKTWLTTTQTSGRFKGRATAEARLFYADRYLRALGSMRNATKKVEDKYDGLGLEDNYQSEKPGTLDNEATDKGAITAANKAAAEARKRRAKAIRAANEEFKNAKEGATAVISAIDEYYNIQESASRDAYNAGKLQKQDFDNLNLFLEKRRNEMLEQARLWMSGRKNEFDKMRKEQFDWGKDRFDITDKSDESVKRIMAFNGDATYKTLVKFDGKNGMPDGRSEIDAISKNASANELKNKEAETKIHDAVVAYLTKNDVANNVADNLAKQLSGLGIAYEDPKKMFMAREAERGDVSGDDTSLAGVMVTAKNKQRTTMQRRILDSFIKNGANNYGFNPTDEKALQSWFQQFTQAQLKFDPTKELGKQVSWGFKEGSFANFMPDADKWVGNFDKYKEQVQSFYLSLIEAEDEYYNNMKSNTDREKRILDQRWERSDAGKSSEQRQRDLQVQQSVESIYGRGDSGAFLNMKELGRNQGFADNIANNPEILLAEEQMKVMQQKLALAKATEKDEQAIRDAERSAQDAELAYAEKINSAIKARIDLLQEWVDPLQEFSESVGDAFIKMTESASEGQQAIKDATQNMVKTFAKMTIDMIAQQLKMEVQRALFHQRMKKSEADYQSGLKEENDKGHKNIFKALGSFFKKKKKDTDKNAKEEKKSKKKEEKEQTDIVQESSEAQAEVKQVTSEETSKIVAKVDNQATQQKTEMAAADAQTTGAEAQGNVFAGIASGAAKIIGKLGWWGIPLIAVIQGLLMGLLNSALSKLFGGSKSSDGATNTKLVTGMLTYDSGNVEAFAGAIDKKTYPVVGNDGKVYAAKPTDSLVTGLLTEPITTMVNGQPSLVAERGPEMIIGRETTQALMMARPDIISEIVKFDRNHSGRTYRAYDGGNVSEAVANYAASAVPSPQAASQSGMADVVATMQQMMPAMQAFIRQLQQPISANVNYYGRGGVYEANQKSSKFMKHKG